MSIVKKNSDFVTKLPLLLAIAISAGIFIGAKMFGGKENSSADIGSNMLKFREVLGSIDRYYVDSANTGELTDVAIKKMLEKLDPHTVYIPAKDMQVSAMQLNSHFEGIGISFYIYHDTLHVESPLAGGPAETVGMRPGDKIVSVNGENIAGTGITNRDVYDKLLGKKGTQVKLEVRRKGTDNLLTFSIVRDKIPQHSVDTYYMTDDKTGYIRLSRFGATAYDEFKKALQDLTAKGMKQLMLDLRGNGGGYMDRAVNIADELIAGDKLIVYTDGRTASSDEEFRAKKVGLFEQGPVIVLIDDGSASASEIVAGALQDNDRALVVGRRSFGKGLVQRPISLSDGSELRLTISRYYTPSGRSIQKHYEAGKRDEYLNEYAQRAAHGELYTSDSIKFDEKKKYKTANGRTVYGGGGIMPDVFVPFDTSYYTPYVRKLVEEQVMREYALEYTNAHKDDLLKMSVEQFEKQFEVNDAMLAALNQLAAERNIKFTPKEFKTSKNFVQRRLKAHIGRNLWREEGWNRVSSGDDEVYLKAVSLFGEAKKLEEGKLSQR